MFNKGDAKGTVQLTNDHDFDGLGVTADLVGSCAGIGACVVLLGICDCENASSVEKCGESGKEK